MPSRAAKKTASKRAPKKTAAKKRAAAKEAPKATASGATNKGGRPSVEGKIDRAMVRKLAAIHCTEDEIALVMDVSKNSIRRHCHAELQRGRAQMKSRLRRAQFRLALEGNATMQVWLGKQYLEQKDRQEHNVSGELNVNPSEHRDGLARKLAALAARKSAQ